MGVTAIYTRLSTEDRDADGDVDPRNLAVQEADLRAEAERRGWSPVEVYVESGVSASRQAEGRRPEFARLLADVEAGKVDRVLAWAADRLHRYALGALKFKELCDDRGVAIVIPAQGINTAEDSSDLPFLLHAGISEEEWKTRSRRAKAYRRRERERGRARIGGRRPFGWRQDGTPEPDEATALRQAVARVLAGEPVSRVAREWNELGVTTATGVRWRPGNLRRALLADVHVPALISEDERALLEARLASKWNGGPAVPAARRYPLTGLATCGKCGTKMVGSGGTDYRCVVVRGGCGGIAIRAYPLEQHVWQEAVRRYQKRWRDAGRPKAKQRQPKADTAPLLKKLREVETRRDEVADGLADGRLAVDVASRALTKLDAERDRLRGKLAETMPVPGPKPDLIERAGEAWDLRRRWKKRELTPKEVQSWHEFVAALAESVDVGPREKRGPGFDDGRVTVAWK